MPRSPRLAHKAPVMQVTLIAVEYARKGKVYLLGSINNRCLGDWARTHPPERELFSSVSLRGSLLHVQPFFVTQRSSSALGDDTKKGCALLWSERLKRLDYLRRGSKTAPGRRRKSSLPLDVLPVCYGLLVKKLGKTTDSSVKQETEVIVSKNEFLIFFTSLYQLLRN